jgi:urea transport system ATP-binding protein
MTAIASAAPLLEVDHVTVSYDGFKALNDLYFSMLPGSVHVLIGPNGAGKSTLLDTIIGRVRPTEGRIVFKGEDISALPEFRIVQRGICRKFQTPGVLDELSVEANILVAATRDRRSWRSFTMTRSAAERERVEEVLTMIGLIAKRKLPAAQLAHGERQWLEIGMVVASDADLLLLDEPAAGMTNREAGATAQLIRQLAGRHALIVIDHDMDFVEQIAAPVSVLHMGSMLAQGTVEEMRRDPQVAAVYLGKAPKGAADAHA